MVVREEEPMMYQDFLDLSCLGIWPFAYSLQYGNDKTKQELLYYDFWNTDSQMEAGYQQGYDFVQNELSLLRLAWSFKLENGF
jgi:hypothetical protein